MSIDACDANGRDSIACRARVPRLLLDGAEREPGASLQRHGVSRAAADDRRGEHAPEGKWAGWLRDDACELDEAIPGENQQHHLDMRS